MSGLMAATEPVGAETPAVEQDDLEVAAEFLQIVLSDPDLLEAEFGALVDDLDDELLDDPTGWVPPAGPPAREPTGPRSAGRGRAPWDRRAAGSRRVRPAARRMPTGRERSPPTAGTLCGP